MFERVVSDFFVLRDLIYQNCPKPKDNGEDEEDDDDFMTTMTLIAKLLVADDGNESSDLLDQFVQPVSSHLLCLVSQLSRRTIKKVFPQMMQNYIGAAGIFHFYVDMHF